MDKLFNYFFGLNIEVPETAEELHYGSDNRKEIVQSLIIYMLLALGIFSRQITKFPVVDLNTINLQWNVLIAAFIIGLALFPAVFNWIFRRKRQLHWTHIVTAFSIGFFIDLSSSLIVNSVLPFLRAFKL